MTRDLASVLGSLEERFTAAADPERAAGMAAYMRDQFKFYGVPAPRQREITRSVLASEVPRSAAELERFAVACWDRPEREWQYVACGHLRRHIRVLSASSLRVVRRLITTKSWWDTVDALAAHVVGPLVRSHSLASTVDSWASSSDIWLARTAILHQLAAKDATDTDRLFAYCLERSGDTEFFIRKAIGWALRTYSKTDPAAVQSFLDRHGTELSGLSRREAARWLNTKVDTS